MAPPVKVTARGHQRTNRQTGQEQIKLASLNSPPHPLNVNKETQTHLRFSWHGTLFDEFKRISNDGMFRWYGLFRHVVRTMTLEDPNWFKTSRSFVLGAHVVKLQCKHSASLVKPKHSWLMYSFYQWPPPPPMKKKWKKDLPPINKNSQPLSLLTNVYTRKRTHMHTYIK